MSAEACAICGQETPDTRTLLLSYGYRLSEASPLLDRGNGEYGISTCKECRGDFIGFLREWCAGQYVQLELREGHGERDVPVRVDGRIVFMTADEWRQYTGRDGEPYRLKQILDGQRELFGRPARLLELLTEHRVLEVTP